ncbi:MAG: 3,4-dehydroadipyl-CoA semialdehyde dehydrogenase [Archangium sp.]|nr:3,4-dehydroadipyl-CoA semialdehyde dehydrogenase [Archangium sp.]
MTTTLSSFLSGRWYTGTGTAATLSNPSTGEPVATCSTGGADFAAAVAHARDVGGPALRAMTFAQRGAMLATLAKCLNDAREELIALAVANGGNTRGDAKFDIDGAAGTLNFYADLGKQLGEVKVLPDGEGVGLGRSARLFGQHVYTPRHGVAVHINAFNFPAWGLGEKAAVAWLAGMPVIAKPATSTALVAWKIAELWVKSGALPTGAFAFIAGGVGDLLSHLQGQDVLAFTGSSNTALTLRRHETVAAQGVHVNIEADSLNSAILGPDVALGSETLNMFFTDVVKEMTQKTGQKCTAVRRIYVPRALLDDVKAGLVERLREVKVGNPADEKHTMGPVATEQQFKDVRAGIERLAAVYETACGGAAPVHPTGCFIAPTLFVNKSPKAVGDVVNGHEVFGPVATLIAYDELPALAAHVAAGGGGLVSSVYSDDREWTAQVLSEIAPFHGRVTVSSEKVAGQTMFPGMVLPQLLHGGPGRAGGGEELGGRRGLALYMQRTALQGPRAWVEAFAGVKAP